MMKILFIQDNAINESLGLTELSALLRSKGHICDLLIHDEENNILRKVQAYSPDIVIFPFGLFGHKFPLYLSRKIKQKSDVPIVFAGEHPTFYPEIIESEGVDIVCRGETEKPISELVESLERGGKIRKIDGLWIKENEKIYRNDLSPVVENLDELPFPDREIYYKYDFIGDFSMKKFMTGRGCYHSCGYCFNPFLREEYRKNGVENYVRKKSVERSIREIENVDKDYPLKHVHFADDLFTADKQWVKEFCEVYRNRIDKPFTFNTTADQIDRDIVKWVSETNCHGVAVGIEAGCKRMRMKTLNKDISDREILNACRMIKDEGMKLTTFNMIGNPSESLDEALQTLRINQKVGSDNPRVNVSHPVPRTSLFKYAVKNDYLDVEEYLNRDITEGMREEAFYKVENEKEFENLYLLFRLACQYPSLTSLTKKLIKLPKNPVFEFVKMITSLWGEKDFYNIPFIDGLKFYLHVKNPYMRTTNFCSLI